MRVSASANSALGGFLAAAFAPDVSTKPIACSSANGEFGDAIHFSVASEDGRIAHLALCAVIRDGRPVLEGYLFDGDPYISVKQAEEWLKSQTVSADALQSDALDNMQEAEQKLGLTDEIALGLAPLAQGTELTSVRRYREHLASAQSFLRLRGFSSGMTSRLGQYLKSLDAYAKDRSDRTLRRALQAIFETRQIAVIFESLADQLSDTQIKHLLSGNFSPSTEAQRPADAGRNYQFELYIAAVCKCAGMKTELKEPDIHVSLAETRLGVAVKRIQSAKMLTARIKEANRQVTQSDLPGIIVVDLTPLFNPENKFLQVFSKHRAREILRGRLERFVQRNRESLIGLAGDATISYLFHAAMPVIWVGHEMGSFTALTGLGIKGEGTVEGRIARDFARLFGQAMMNPSPNVNYAA